MDHFTSPAPRGRDETQARSLTRRHFLTGIAANAAAAAAFTAALSLPKPAHAQTGDAHTPAPPPEKPVMTGAQYAAFLGGPVEPHYDIHTENDYPSRNGRWVAVAMGPLIDALDDGTLTICPKCLFVSYRGVPCQICELLPFVTYEDVSGYLEAEDGDEPMTLDEMAEEVRLYRMGRAVDLVDGPDCAWFSAAMVYAQDYLKAQAA